MRLFVAIDAEGHVKSEIQEVVDVLSSRHKNCTWVAPDNLHFTLKFLGDIDEKDVTAIEDAIEKSLAGFKPFKINVHGLGYFGKRRAARVIWVGVHEGRDEMAGLASELEKKLSVFRGDDKPFNSHITICRPGGDTSKLVEDIEKEKQRSFGVMEVREVALKKSTLTQNGALYSDVKVFMFADSSD